MRPFALPAAVTRGFSCRGGFWTIPLDGFWSRRGNRNGGSSRGFGRALELLNGELACAPRAPATGDEVGGGGTAEKRLHASACSCLPRRIGCSHWIVTAGDKGALETGQVGGGGVFRPAPCQ